MRVFLLVAIVASALATGTWKQVEPEAPIAPVKEGKIVYQSPIYTYQTQAVEEEKEEPNYKMYGFIWPKEKYQDCALALLNHYKTAFVDDDDELLYTEDFLREITNAIVTGSSFALGDKVCKGFLLGINTAPQEATANPHIETTGEFPWYASAVGCLDKDEVREMDMEAFTRSFFESLDEVKFEVDMKVPLKPQPVLQRPGHFRLKKKLKFF